MKNLLFCCAFLVLPLFITEKAYASSKSNPAKLATKYFKFINWGTVTIPQVICEDDDEMIIETNLYPTGWMGGFALTNPTFLDIAIQMPASHPAGRIKIADGTVLACFDIPANSNQVIMWYTTNPFAYHFNIYWEETPC